MINTIILDIGNVLAHFGWKEYLVSCGYNEDIIQRVGNTTVHSKVWKEWDRGLMDEKDLIELSCSMGNGVEAQIRDFFEHILTMVEEYDYSVNFVKKLKESGYHIYLLSNYNKQHFEHDSRSFKFMPFVDGGIISYQVNSIKPEAKIYESLIQKYDINPTETVFLDDIQENLEGAKPFGFHTLQVKSYQQALGDLRKLGVNI